MMRERMDTPDCSERLRRVACRGSGISTVVRIAMTLLCHDSKLRQSVPQRQGSNQSQQRIGMQAEKLRCNLVISVRLGPCADDAFPLCLADRGKDRRHLGISMTGQRLR